MKYINMSKSAGLALPYHCLRGLAFAFYMTMRVGVDAQPGTVAALTPIGSDGCDVDEVTYTLTYESYRIYQVGLTFSEGGAGTLSKQFLNGEFKIDWSSPGTVLIDFSYYDGFEIKSYSGLPVLATYSLLGNPGTMKVKRLSSFLSSGSRVEYNTSVTLVAAGANGDWSFQKCTGNNCPSDSDTNWTTTASTTHTIQQKTRFRVKSTSCGVGYSNVFIVDAYEEFTPGNVELPTDDVCDGEEFTLQSQFDASGGRTPIEYQWYGSNNEVDWTIISRAGGSSASLPNVSLSGPFRFYKRRASSDFQEDLYSNTLDLNTLVVQEPLDPGQLDPKTICDNTAPGLITGTEARGGSGTLTYQWSVSSDKISWGSISGESASITYSEKLRGESKFYIRRQVTASFCGGTESAILEVNVLAPYSAGTLNSISRPQYGTKVKDISLSVSGAYPNSVIYQFCTSGCNDDNNWKNQSNNNTAITGDVWFRARLQDNTCGNKYTPVKSVRSYNQFFEGTIVGPDNNQCESVEELIVGSGLEASGGKGTPSYQWQYHNGSTWVNIPDEPGRPADQAELKVSVPLKYSRVHRIASSDFGEAQPSNEVDLSEITFAPPLDPGYLDPQTLCPGGTAEEISGTAPSGGGGVESFTWQFRNEGGTWSDEYSGGEKWVDVATFASDLNDHLYVRRNVYAACESGSTEVKITILPGDTPVCELGGLADLVTPLTGQLFYRNERTIGVSWGYYPELGDATLQYVQGGQSTTVQSGIPNAEIDGAVRYDWDVPLLADERFDLLVTNEVKLVEFQARNLEYVDQIELLLKPGYDKLYLIDEQLEVEWIGGSDQQPFRLSIVKVATDSEVWHSGEVLQRTFEGVVSGLDPAITYKFRIAQSNLMEEFEMAVIDTSIPTASSERNYVKVYRPRDETKIPPSHTNNPAGGESILAIQYFDGLGRLDQVVNQAASSQTTLDIITPASYDQFGRANKDWLPFEGTAGDGRFIEGAESGQRDHYERLYPGEGDYAFGQKIYEPSPLNRVVAQGAPGEDWAATGDHKAEFLYKMNESDEVRKIYVENDQIRFAEGFYPESQLYKNVVLDENPGGNRGETVQFTNKSGEVVLKKIKLSQTGESTVYGQTYYLYDEFGNLRHVIQPEGVREIEEGEDDWALVTEDQFQQRWMFSYRYDDRQRMIAKRVPGAAWVYMVYDDRDRLVLTQDGNDRGEAVLPETFEKVPADQKVDEYEGLNYYVEPSGSVTFTPGFQVSGNTATDNEFLATSKTLADREFFGKIWQFTKYDYLNRPILTGFVEIDAPENDITEVIADFYEDDDASYFDSYDGEDELGGYTNESFPTNITDEDVLTITYYDDYDFAGEDIPDGALPVVKGQVTGTMTRVLGTEELLSAVMFYDDRYRVVQTIMNNHLDGQDWSLIQYRNKVSSLVESETFYHEGEEDLEIWRTYGYDHMDRLLIAQQSLTLDAPGQFHNIAVNTYNDRSQLIEKDLGGRLGNGGDPVQSVDYAYNIRGWLTSINGGASAFDDALDQFGMELSYNSDDPLRGQFNGNISAMSWKSLGGDSPGIVQNYAYGYDAASRLKSATYSGLGNHSVEGLAYDYNGNIQRLTRHQRVGAMDHIIDRLSYAYETGNQLSAVQDAGSTVPYSDEDNAQLSEIKDLGFFDGAVRSNEYIYDDNGNMTRDFNKGINSILYNHLNLPEIVRMDDGTTIRYLYSADGTKLRKTVESGDNGSQIDYMGDVQYRDGELEFVRHAEGRAVYQGSNEEEELEEFSYEFNLTDHLGNVRVVVSDLEQYTYLLTMESENAEVEEAQYVAASIGEIRTVNAVANTTEGGNEVARLVSGTGNQSKGAFVLIEVQGGNKLDISVNARYEPSEQPQQSLAAASALAGVAAATGPSGSLEGAAAATGGSALDIGTAGISSNGEVIVPEAYLNYLLVDETFEVTKVGFVQMSEAAAGNIEKLALEGLDLDHTGYLQVWLSVENEEPGFVVDFDDMTIIQRNDFVKQVQDYYPFGLTFNEWTRSPENLYKFQGQEHQPELGWDQFKWRNADPALGRFFNVDPLAEKYLYNSPYAFSENKVVAHIELEGLESLYAPGHGGQKLIRSNFKKQGTSFYYREGGVQVGLHQGFVAVQQEGVAYDEVGKTQFTSRSLGMVGSRFEKGTGVSGADIGLSFGFKVDGRPTFLQASEGIDNSFPLKFGLGMEFSETSFSMTLGAQAGVSFVSKGDDIVQSISLSYDQAKSVNDITGVILETWEVGGVSPILDDNGNVTGYFGSVTVKDTDGTVLDTGVQVFSGADQTQWASQEYIDGVKNLEENN